MTRFSCPLALLLSLALVACEGGAGSSPDASGGIGDTEDTQPYAGIGADEVLHFTGTEPFWGGQVVGGTLTYSTPENVDGTQIAVERFAGRNGISFSGTLDGRNFVMAVTPGECSDGMSDRTYPFTVTLAVRGEQRQGCAWTDEQGFTGPQQP